MLAKQIYTIRSIAEDMKQVLTHRGVPFLYDETGLIGRGKVSLQGVDSPLTVAIDATEHLLTLAIGLPVLFAEEDNAAAAQALCKINDGLTAGCFELHGGAVSVRTSTFFRESQLSTAALLDLLELCLALAEVHLTALRQLAQREINMERFIATLL